MLLQIRHMADSDPATFQVLRLRDGQMGPVADAVPDPVKYPVEGWPDQTLLLGLRWYLEDFLELPVGPNLSHARQVQSALVRWGEQAFDALFDNRIVGGWLGDAIASNYADLYLQIVSSDAGVLAWPWEALRDRQAGRRFAHACQVERRLDGLLDPLKAKKLPRDRVNILLLIARPDGRGDIRFRSIARALVEWAARPDVPAYVHVLRPPTLDQLRAHLRQHPNFYHILHFDGHGAYRAGSPTTPFDPRKYQGAVQGHLIFEKEDGSADPVTAEKLTELLQEGAVPAVVLNACQSAMVDDRADDAFASVAAALLRTRLRSVVAMAYSLYVSAAQQFLPAFYRRLFETGQFADAVRAGRQQLLSRSARTPLLQDFTFDDWLVPVLYQQEAPDFKFLKKVKRKKETESRLPSAARDDRSGHGFIGRDGVFLELERALRRAPAGVLITGLGGVGKTTLVQRFLHWLEQTGGLREAVFWFSFIEINSAEYIFNRLGEVLIDPNFPAWGMAQKFDDLVAACQEHRLLLIWDNFESVQGIPGLPLSARMPAEDVTLLKTFLERLRGGLTKVLLTSRSAEDWLGGPSVRFVVKLGGLDGEERWEYANALLADLGKVPDRADKDFAELMNLLGGHPLAMRVVLPRLESRTAADLAGCLRDNVEGLQSRVADEAETRVFATLRLAADALPERLRPLLVPLGLHEGFADANSFAEMARQVAGGWERAQIDDFFRALAAAGLMRELGHPMFELHPLLTGFLRSRGGPTDPEAVTRWSRAFVDVMGHVADGLGPRPLHEQRLWFRLHGANFERARGEAERLGMGLYYAALTQALAAHALNGWDFEVAARLFETLAEYSRGAREEPGEASAYHQLGRVAQDRRDLNAAENWYRKSLEIKQRLHDDHGTAIAYHQLGRVAQERRDFAAAEDWFRKSLKIKERLHDDHSAAMTYHELGTVAAEVRDFDAAESWHRKAQKTFERLYDDHYAAITYHELGITAQARRDFDAAETWYHKAKKIFERLGDDHSAAGTYRQLGTVAQELREFQAAERWYRKSLQIEERRGNHHGAAIAYHQLGILAAERRDFDAAEGWYLKAQQTFERLHDEHGAALTDGGLGRVAEGRRHFDTAEQRYHKALQVFERLHDDHHAAIVRSSLERVAQARKGSS